MGGATYSSNKLRNSKGILQILSSFDFIVGEPTGNPFSEKKRRCTSRKVKKKLEINGICAWAYSKLGG